MKEPAVPPAVLAKVAQLAGVKDFPLTENLYGYALKTTARERFEVSIRASVWTTHYALSDPATLKAAAKAGPMVRKLIEMPSHLSDWLSSSDIMALTRVAKEIRNFELRKKVKRRGNQAEIIRKGFVNRLLSIAHDAGGKLSLNRRNECGSLVEVLNLLKPYLPAEFQRGLSVPTLRRIKQTWLKKQKNRSKNP
jgi:hypothetical protein